MQKFREISTFFAKICYITAVLHTIHDSKDKHGSEERYAKSAVIFFLLRFETTNKDIFH